jgi:KaiC/GvpD/RAD55 family RecA-like ATPase
MLTLNPGQIEDYLRSQNLRLRRRGNKAEIEICPFCDGGPNKDKWKTVVYLDETGGNYRCLRGHCDASGSFWQLVEQLGGDPKSFYSNDRQPAQPAAPRLKEITFKTQKVETSALTPTAIAYLKQRGFTKETVENAPIWCDSTGLIVLGFYHQGSLCMTKLRRPGPVPAGSWKSKGGWEGGLRTLWGLELVDKSVPYLVITFGEFDALALRQSRVPNAVSAGSDTDLEWLDICYDELAGFKEIILFPDNDDSCRKAIPRIAERLGKAKVRIVKYDDRFKDPNDMLVKLTAETDGESAESAILQAVRDAEWYHSGDIKQLSEVGDDEQTFSGYLSGIADIDQQLGGFFQSQVTLHAGSTKSGKSAVVNQYAAMAAEQGGRVCMWAGEDSASDLRYKLSVHIGGFSGTETRLSSRTLTEYQCVKESYKPRISKFLHDRIIFIDRRMGLNEDMLIENFLLAFQRFGCDTFIVDNIAKLVLSKDSENIFLRQAQIINKLSDFAKEYRVHLHVVAHTSKGSETELPTRNNISGTKDLINLADRTILYWRVPEEMKHLYNYCETVIIIAADRIFGIESSTPTRYHRLTRRFGGTEAEIGREYSI